MNDNDRIMSSSSSSGKHAQSLNHAWLDGMERQPPRHEAPDEIGHNSLMEPLIPSYSTALANDSTTGSSNKQSKQNMMVMEADEENHSMHDPLLLPQQAPRNKVVRFQTDATVSPSASFNDRGDLPIPNHTRLRQRNAPTTRLLNRYSNHTANNHHQSGVWNVQHIHTPQLHPGRYFRDTIYDSNDNDIEQNHSNHDDDDHDDHCHITDIDRHHGINGADTTNRNCHRRRAYCTACYEFWNTWFYTLAYQRTIVLILILFTTYTGIVIFYATIYYTMSRIGQSLQSTHTDHDHDQHPDNTAPHTITDQFHQYTSMTARTLSVLLLYLFCDMDLHSFMEALYFSLSTMASIGYGVSDYYFGNCGVLPLFVVLLQICTAICYDAIAIGLLFQRLRRSHKRSKSILFTNTAIVQRIQQVPYLMFRIAELRHYPLVNATIRAYCIGHDHYPIPNTPMNNNNDIDLDRPVPTTTTSKTTSDNRIVPNDSHIQSSYFVTKPMILQQRDILMNIPQMIVHPIRTNESPLCPPHIWYDQNGMKHTFGQRHHDPPITTFDGPTNDQENDCWLVEDMEQIQLYMQDRNMEIIIVVEGTDELTGTCTQTKQSYTYSDIQWNCQFVSCMLPATAMTNSRSARVSGGGGCIVDFAAFHLVESAPVNMDYSPYIQ